MAGKISGGQLVLEWKGPDDSIGAVRGVQLSCSARLGEETARRRHEEVPFKIYKMSLSS